MTWRITDVWRSRETGQYVCVFERGDTWLSVDLTVRWYHEKRMAYLQDISVDWVKRATLEQTAEVERFVRENDDYVFGAVMEMGAAA